MTDPAQTFLPIPGHFKGGPMDGKPFQLTAPREPDGSGGTLRGALLVYNIDGRWYGYELTMVADYPYQELSYLGEQDPPRVKRGV